MASTTGDVRGTAGTAMETIAEPENGWVLFASLMILFTGIWNAFEGFFGFFRSAFFIGSPVFGSLWVWALLLLIFGIVQIAAAGAIMSGQSWGRWFGIVVVGLGAFVHLLAIPVYPWWSMVIVAIDILILYGLTARWRGATTAA